MELHCAHKKSEIFQKELTFLSKEREDLLVQIRELDKGSDEKNDSKVFASVCFVAEITVIAKNIWESVTSFSLAIGK